MKNFYIEYNKESMILKIKSLLGEKVTAIKIIEFSEILISGDVYFKDEPNDIYGYVVQNPELVESQLNKIENFDIKKIIDRLVLIEDISKRDIVKNKLPNYYCIDINDINNEINKAIFIYNKI